MNNQLLRRQVDDFFSRSKSHQLSAWRQYKSQIRNNIEAYVSNPIRCAKVPSAVRLKTSAKISHLTKAQDYFNKVFKSSPEHITSIESLSDIPVKEGPTLSLGPKIPEILPVESIRTVRELLITTNLSEEYTEELLKLSEDIQKYSRKTEFS